MTSLSRATILTLTLTLAMTVGARSQSRGGAEVGEIVVTAERRSEYDPQRTPHVTLTRRADNLITEVKVVCDTRDPTLRRQELRDTLRTLIQEAAHSDAIALGVGDSVLIPFDSSMIEAAIAPDSKTDTSRATLVIKTPVRASDSFDAATARITGFIKRVHASGRTEILRQGDWNLTLINPERSRPELLARIAQDARATAAAFGPGYGVQADGLQHPIDWYQATDLDLALFIAYRLVVVPDTGRPGGSPP